MESFCAESRNTILKYSSEDKGFFLLFDGTSIRMKANCNDGLNLYKKVIFLSLIAEWKTISFMYYGHIKKCP